MSYYLDTIPVSTPISQGFWQVGNYTATHLPYPHLQTHAWVIWHAAKPVAVVESFSQVRDWVRGQDGGAQ
jgi:hypothetical protein